MKQQLQGLLRNYKAYVLKGTTGDPIVSEIRVQKITTATTHTYFYDGSMKIKNHCPKSIIIYEGENSGSNESTDYMLKHYPLREESYYEDWVKQETKRLSAGGGK